MQVNYIACTQIEKNGRVYSLFLPNEAPFEEANQVLLEMAKGILEIKKEREEALEKAKLEQEMNNAKAEAKYAA